jgi:hypothetical protein
MMTEIADDARGAGIAHKDIAVDAEGEDAVLNAGAGG